MVLPLMIMLLWICDSALEFSQSTTDKVVLDLFTQEPTLDANGTIVVNVASVVDLLCTQKIVLQDDVFPQYPFMGGESIEMYHKFSCQHSSNLQHLSCYAWSSVVTIKNEDI